MRVSVISCSHGFEFGRRDRTDQVGLDRMVAGSREAGFELLDGGDENHRWKRAWWFPLALRFWRIAFRQLVQIVVGLML
jgi:hypothetical protein